MKATKTIATICAVSMAATMLSLPVQAKTYPKTSEVITMDDTATTTKSKSKKTDEYKDFGKDLKVTVHTPNEITQAYLYANMMCAKSLKITLAKDYRLTSSSTTYEISDQLGLVCNGMLFGGVCTEIEWSDETRSATLKNFGDVMSYFTYVYRTGDTDKIPQNYEGMYAFFAAGVVSCTADADSITDVADNICKWLKENTVYGGKNSFAGVIGKSGISRTANGKMILNCEGYSYVFMTLMRMAGYTAYHVRGTEHGGRHSWNAIKVGDEYRYYEPQSTLKGSMTYKEMIKAGYAPEAWYRDKDGIADFKTSPTQKQVEALFVDWH